MRGIADPECFFSLVPEVLPDATHLFVEGGSISPDVAACYERVADPGPYLPRRQTVWPRARLFRCASSAALFAELADLAARHAAPELLDHLAIYRVERPLLNWHDAFANALLIDASVPEEKVAALASAFGCAYGRARSSTT
jgi:hypothetical protein